MPKVEVMSLLLRSRIVALRIGSMGLRGIETKIEVGDEDEDDYWISRVRSSLRISWSETRRIRRLREGR